MKFRITSDWHLNHYYPWIAPDPNKRSISGFYIDHHALLKETDDDKNQILLIAGDMGDFNTDWDYWTATLETISKRFKEIYYVTGNHDFYHGVYPKNILEITKFFAKFGIFVCHNSWIEKEGVSLYSTPLWSSYDNGNYGSMLAAERGMYDHKLIRTPEHEFFSAADAYNEHLAQKKMLESFLEQSKTLGTKRIVMTHHCPSLQSVHPKYAGSQLNGAFASNLDEMILQYAPDFWIHGHTHHSFDYNIGLTRVICNPVAYPNENSDYNSNLVIEV